MSNSQSFALPASLHAPARTWLAADTTLGRLAFAILWIFVFVMPWESSVPLVGGFVISRWFALAAATVLILAVLAAHRLRRPCAIHLLMLAFVAWSALSLFWTIDPDSSFSRVSTYAQLLLVVWMIWELAPDEDRVISLLKAYMFGAAVMAADTIFSYSTGVDIAAMDVEHKGYRYSVYGIDANDLALMIALSIPIAIYLLARPRGQWIKLYCWIHIGVCLISLLLAGSRGGLISTGVALAAFPLLASRMARIHRLGFILVCTAGIALGIYFVPPDDWQRILNTGKEISQGTMTHRTMLWDAGFEVLRSNAWLGVGAGAYAIAILRQTGAALVAHDTYISALVEMGVPGLLLLVSLVLALFYCTRRLDICERRLWTILLLTWCIGVSALTWEYRKPTWFLFAALAAQAYSRSKEKMDAGPGRRPYSFDY